MPSGYYRQVYLKSDHWKDLRLSKLASVDARCRLCMERNLSNDVHHIVYKKLFDVTEDDLVVLCRFCHNKVHEVLAECVEIKDEKEAHQKWLVTVSRLKDKNASEPFCFDGMLAVTTAKRLYKEASLRSPFPFPKIREGRIITSFFKANPNASQGEWEAFATSLSRIPNKGLSSKALIPA